MRRKCVLVCFTSAGYCCLHAEYPSIAEARRIARTIRDEGFAHSFKIYRVK